jgi:hypothetical protein
VDRDRSVLVAGYVVLALLGAVLGVYGAFLVPLRLFGQVEGFADVLGIVATGVAGYFGAIGLGRASAAVMPGIGWIVAVVLLNISRGGDVVIPGSLASDPGIGIVGTLYLLSGLAGTLAAGVLAGRRFRPR